jgi:hypothetical protein
MHTATLSISLATLALVVPAAQAQTITPLFAANYAVQNYGRPAGLPGSAGGILFDGPDALLIGGNANNSSGGIYRLIPVRDLTTQRITGFAGPATLVAQAPNIDGGLWFMPNGTLAFTTFSNNNIGQITRAAFDLGTPTSPAPATIINLTPLGVDSSVGTGLIVPPGFPGAGTLKIASYSSGRWFTLPFSPANPPAPANTYTFGQAVSGLPVGQATPCPEGIFYINTNSPLFQQQNVLVTDYCSGTITAYGIDTQGFPIISTARTLVVNYSGVYGGTRDPLTGDIFFTSYSTGVIAAVRGFGLPVLRCGQADVAGSGQFQGFDGRLTADDIIVFLGWYFNADPRADIAGPNQTFGPDTQFTADDIIVFLSFYFAGC